MKIFTVRAPFVDKTTRFGAPGKLVVGIAETALKSNPTYGFKLGTGNIVYTGDSSELLAYSHACGSVWTNRQGKRVCILPVELFKQEGALPTYDLPKRPVKLDSTQLSFNAGTV